MDLLFKNQQPGEGCVKLYLYGDIGGDNEKKVESRDIVSALDMLAKEYGAIEIHINSRGGDVFAGFAILSAIRTCKAEIRIVIDGLAASIAGVIALSGRKLTMNPYARLMLHRVSAGGYGTAEDLRRVAQLAESMEKDICDVLSVRLNMTSEDIHAKYFDGADHWISAREALELGMIDGLTTVDVKPEADTADGIYNFTNSLQQASKPKNKMALIDELRKRPSFDNCTTDEQVLQHVSSLENQAAKVPALENKVKELTTQVNEQKKAACTAYLNQAVSEGKLTKDQVPSFLNLMLADEKSAREAIDAMPRRTGKVEDFLNSSHAGTNPDLASMSWDQIDKAERLQELKNSYPELYKQKFNEKFKA